MRLTNRHDVAHAFFYQTDDSNYTFGGTCSFDENIFFSYRTCIGEITEDINGQRVLLISDNHFSNTTNKHLSALASASPFYKNYYFPQYRGNRVFFTNEILEIIKINLQPSNFKRKENREAFTHNFKMLKNMLLIKKFQDYKKEIIQLLKDNVKTYQLITNDTKFKEYKKQEALKQQEKQKKLKEELKDFIQNYSYLDLVKWFNTSYFFNDYSIEAYNQEKKLKPKAEKLFNPKKDLSFIWVEGEKIKTSQYITVDSKEVTALLKLYLKAKLKRGMKISYYTILEIKSTYIKIGCHKIPIENINALIAYLGLRQEEEQAA